MKRLSVFLFACAVMVMTGLPSQPAEPAFSWSNPIRFEGPGPERGRNELRDPCIIRETWGFLCIDPMDVDKTGRVLGPEPSIGAMTVQVKNRQFTPIFANGVH